MVQRLNKNKFDSPYEADIKVSECKNKGCFCLRICGFDLQELRVYELELEGGLRNGVRGLGGLGM